MVDGQTADVVLGGQGLWMFVTNARTCGMDVGDGDHEGVVVFSALDDAGETVSIDFSCRVREFVERPGGGCPDRSNYRYLSESYQMPLRADLGTSLDGARISIQLEVRDVAGRRATSAHTVVAHFVTSSP